MFDICDKSLATHKDIYHNHLYLVHSNKVYAWKGELIGWRPSVQNECDMNGRHFKSLNEKPNALDEQVGGNHYTKYKIQPMEYSVANELDPLQHTIIKYATRHKDKNGIEDLKKIIHTTKLAAKLNYNIDL